MKKQVLCKNMKQYRKAKKIILESNNSNRYIPVLEAINNNELYMFDPDLFDQWYELSDDIQKKDIISAGINAFKAIFYLPITYVDNTHGTRYKDRSARIIDINDYKQAYGLTPQVKGFLVKDLTNEAEAIDEFLNIYFRHNNYNISFNY